MINRDRAIRVLEAYDDTWDYEDMEDDELVERIARSIGCAKAGDVDLGRCKDTNCIACWRITLSR